MVSQELLDILRCPHCARDGTGVLDHAGNWLICKNCDRKYPIRDDIPVMLIEEGERFRDVPRQELPEIPPPEERKLGPMPAAPSQPADEQQRWLLVLIGAAIGIGLAILLMVWLQKRKGE